jgi:hypothetical protein
MCPLRNIVGRLFLLVLRRIVASLALAGTIYYISKGDLLSVRPPSV